MSADHVSLPFDPNDPPVDIPARCKDRLLWVVARQLFADHQPGADGFCQVCRPCEFHPCYSWQLADLALRISCEPRGLSVSRLLGKPPSDPFEGQRWLLSAPIVQTKCADLGISGLLNDLNHRKNRST